MKTNMWTGLVLVLGLLGSSSAWAQAQCVNPSYESDGFDFGDAPENYVENDPDPEIDITDVSNTFSFNYQTTVENCGASHALSSPLRLGLLVDSESDGQPSEDALCDDFNCGEVTVGRVAPAVNCDSESCDWEETDDEDGIVFGDIGFTGWYRTLGNFVIAGQFMYVDATVSGAPGRTRARLDGFSDFYASGRWGVTPLFQRAYVRNGVTRIRYQVPAGAVRGPTYTRFRLSTAGVLSPSGSAPDGEVEDYQVTVLSKTTLRNFTGRYSKSQRSITLSVNLTSSNLINPVNGDLVVVPNPGQPLPSSSTKPYVVEQPVSDREVTFYSNLPSAPLMSAGEGSGYLCEAEESATVPGLYTCTYSPGDAVVWSAVNIDDMLKAIARAGARAVFEGVPGTPYLAPSTATTRISTVR